MAQTSPREKRLEDKRRRHLVHDLFAIPTRYIGRDQRLGRLCGRHAFVDTMDLARKYPAQCFDKSIHLLCRDPAFAGERYRISHNEFAHPIRFHVFLNTREIRAQVGTFERTERQGVGFGRVGEREPDAFAADVKPENRYDAAFGFLPR